MRTGTGLFPKAVVGAIQGLRAIRHSAKAITVSTIFVYKSFSWMCVFISPPFHLSLKRSFNERFKNTKPHLYKKWGLDIQLHGNLLVEGYFLAFFSYLFRDSSIRRLMASERECIRFSKRKSSILSSRSFSTVNRILGLSVAIIV